MTFEQHAAECYPKECCGLMVGGKYIPCRNTATEPDMIEIHPEDWAAAEDRGEIQAICHSHPDGSEQPSELDVKMMKLTRVPWWILSWPAGRLKKISPIDHLLGREFIYGKQDCFSLAREYYKQVWDLDIPDFDHCEFGWWKHGKDIFTDGFHLTGFYDIPMADLRVGDGILMQIDSPVPNHAAMLVEDGIILHHLAKRLSTRDIYGEYFRKVSVRFLRHDKCSPK